MMSRKLPEILVTVLLLFGAFFVGRAGGRLAAATAGSESVSGGAVIVVDAGHGGDDPGKVSVTGTNEKDLNLSIAKKVKACLEAYGCTVTMTRTTDAALCDDSTTNKKQQDMKNRCRIIDETAPALTVSIHQNSYTDSAVKGPQVFYYENSEEGKKAAACIQEAMNTGLAIERPRAIKANDTYYLLKRTKAAVLIVECGFLSNPEEAAKLETEEYQQQVAESICEGVAAYLKGL
ncbi:MAG: N-acetylmuramoyl-L-alanine amidase [Eubacteriales bacterium]|nr:N-acetylmuramoyl-L-alanine amidase [Eubacteriales bacterium]